MNGCTAPRDTPVLAGYQAEFRDIWQAALAAATNSALNRLPAFGGRRPDEAWLAQQLQDRTAAVAATLEPEQLAAALLTPVLAAAENLLQQQQQQQQQEADAAADAAGSCDPAGWLLLCSLCGALQSAYSTESVPTQQLRPLAAGAIALLVQHANLPMPAALPGMLCAAAKAAAAGGDVSVYKTAVQHALQLKLSSADLAAVTSAAVAGAAAAAAAQRSDTGSTYALQQLWPSVLQSASTEQSSEGCHTDDAAAAVVAAVAVNTAVAHLLLAEAALPSALLIQLLQAAVDSKRSSTVQQLLEHAEQHQLLQQLPPALLLTAVGRSSSTDAAATIGYAQQAVERLLQQGQAPDATAAAVLLPGTAATEDEWQQLLAWLKKQCSTAPAAAAHGLLCNVLLASPSKQTADQTWQLYQLLQRCQNAGSWPAAQQGLPAAAASAVIEQQFYAAASSDRLLQLWDKQQQTEAGQKLTTAALTAVMSALVASEQHAAALRLVAQQDAALLVPLADLWQQHVPSTDVLVQALQQVCAFSSQLGSAAAANVAEQLLALLEQQQALQQTVQAQPATAVQLVQLLSEQSMLAVALRVVTCMLDQASATGVSPAMTVSLVTALAQQQLELQPAAAAVAFGLVSAEDLTAAGADSIYSDSAATSADAIRASQLIAQLCCMQLPQQGVADLEELSDTVSIWVDKLSHGAAAAALFSTWYWSQPTAAAAAGSVATPQTLQLPAASSIGVLGLSLYAAARDGKPSLSSLLLDLALVAAADARDWDRGALATMLQAYTACGSQASGSGAAAVLA
jgi:hypothetical protein